MLQNCEALEMKVRRCELELFALFLSRHYFVASLSEPQSATFNLCTWLLATADEKEEDESDVKSLIKSLIDADHDFDGKLKVIEIDSEDTGELPGFDSIYDSLLQGGWWSCYVSVKLINKQALLGPKINIRKWIYKDCIKQIKLN